MYIRLLTQDDWGSWRDIRLEALHDSPEAFGSSYEEEKDYSEDDWKSSFIKSDVFGAFIKEDLVGTVGFFTLNHLKTKHKGVLFAVYTKPEHRGKGVGRKLVETLISHAKLHVIQLHLTVVTSNDLALKFYETLGFKVFGTEPLSLKIGEIFYDEYLMALDLR